MVASGQHHTLADLSQERAATLSHWKIGQVQGPKWTFKRREKYFLNPEFYIMGRLLDFVCNGDCSRFDYRKIGCFVHIHRIGNKKSYFQLQGKHIYNKVICCNEEYFCCELIILGGKFRVYIWTSFVRNRSCCRKDINRRNFNADCYEKIMFVFRE